MSTVTLTKQDQNPFLRALKFVWSNYSIIVVTLVFFIAMGFVVPRFVQFSNIMVILRQASIIGVLAVGMTFVIITGGIDLSSGHVVAASGAVLIFLQGNPDYPLIVPILACFVTATALGFINGLIITKFRLPAFIVTLAIGVMARSVAVYMVGGRSITGIREAPFTTIGAGSIGFVSYTLIVWVVLTLIAAYVLKYTKYGAYTYAVGGNETASKYAGISTNKVKIMAYGLTGLCAGITALLDFSFMASIAVPTSAYLYEFDAITAVIVGGTALSGGRGKVLNTFFGVIIIISVNNLMVMLGISPYLGGAIRGLVILAAVLLQRREK